MNLKNVLKTYSLLRSLSDDESALLNTLRGLSEPERELLVESLQPAAKKPERSQQPRCTHVYASGLVCNVASRNIVHHNSAHSDFHQFTTEKAKKSKHQQSLAGAIKKNTASRTVTGPACSICGNVEDHPDHDVDHYLSAHEFESGKSPAQSAAAKSSTNGEAANSTASTEAQTVNAASAVGGSGEN